MFLVRRRKTGFTLVELLIVIIIIGVLAGMLVLALGKANDKAEATKIINNMVVLKKACLLYYTDHGSWPEGLLSGSKNNNSSANDYLGEYLDQKIGSDYSLVCRVTKYKTDDPKGFNGSIFVKYSNANALAPGVREDRFTIQVQQQERSQAIQRNQQAGG